MSESGGGRRRLAILHWSLFPFPCRLSWENGLKGQARIWNFWTVASEPKHCLRVHRTSPIRIRPNSLWEREQNQHGNTSLCPADSLVTNVVASAFQIPNEKKMYLTHWQWCPTNLDWCLWRMHLTKIKKHTEWVKACCSAEPRISEKS